MWPIRKKNTLMLKLYLVVVIIICVLAFSEPFNIVLHLLSIRRHPDKSLSVRKGPLNGDHDGDHADVDDVEGGVWVDYDGGDPADADDVEGEVFSPHDHTGTKRQPLVVTDYLVRSPFHLRPSQ